MQSAKQSLHYFADRQTPTILEISATSSQSVASTSTRMPGIVSVVKHSALRCIETALVFKASCRSNVEHYVISLSCGPITH